MIILTCIIVWLLVIPKFLIRFFALASLQGSNWLKKKGMINEIPNDDFSMRYQFIYINLSMKISILEWVMMKMKKKYKTKTYSASQSKSMYKERMVDF